MSLILEGNIRAVNVNSSGQMVFKFDDDGKGLTYTTEGDQLALPERYPGLRETQLIHCSRPEPSKLMVWRCGSQKIISGQ